MRVVSISLSNSQQERKRLYFPKYCTIPLWEPQSYVIQRDVFTSSQIATKPGIRVTPDTGISFFSSSQALPKKTTTNHCGIGFKCLFSTSLTSLSIHLVYFLFSSLNQSHPQGRSEDLKAESGAVKSGCNRSPLCGREGKCEGKTPHCGSLCAGSKSTRPGWGWRMDTSGSRFSAAEEMTGNKMYCLYVCWLCTQHEHKPWSHSSFPLTGWLSYLVRPLAILANKQFVLRAGLR